MARRDAVTAVTGRLFEDDWGKAGKSRGIRNARHMARAAQGASPAFFKMIRTGGCASRGQLSAQFQYLFSKSVDVIDSGGLFDGKKSLSSEQVERAVDRWADNWKGQLNSARTTHLVMSFPRNAKPNHVSLIASEICREKLHGRFEYMIAVHTDAPNKNPHAHIIVNRRGGQGEYFRLSRGTEFSYETFKDAMVDHARKYGIQLEATTRLQRGHTTYGPTTAQWRRAQEQALREGRTFEAPAGTPRSGAALARAQEEVRDWSLRYRDLSSYASASNMQDIATAFEKAADILAKGGNISAKGEPYMSVNEDFDRAAADLKNAVDRVEQSIATAAPNQRPAMEKQLADALASVEHLQPLGPRSRELRELASEDGIYSAQNTDAIASRLALEGREKMAISLEGTGIDPIEVEARMRAGANSAALESRWAQQDVQSVADMRGFDLRDPAQREQAINVVDNAYNAIARDYGIDDAIEQQGQGVDAIAEYDARFPNGDTWMADGTERTWDDVLKDEADALGARAESEFASTEDIDVSDLEPLRPIPLSEHPIFGDQDNSEGSAETATQRMQTYTLSHSRTGEVELFNTATEAGRAFADADATSSPRVIESDGSFARTVASTVVVANQEQKTAPALDVVERDTSFNERDREFWRGYHERVMSAHRDMDAQEHAPTASIGSADGGQHELKRFANPVGADDEKRLREAIERTLTPNELERLKRGEADVLEGVGNRQDQLTMARDYLRTSNEPSSKQALDRVNEELSAEREYHRRQRGHDGGAHE